MDKILDKICSKLKKIDGIYFSEDKKNISYPEDGNNMCFELEDNSFWFINRNNIIYKLIEKKQNELKKEIFIDVGGGNGYVSYFLQKKGLNVLLLEPGEKGVFNAKKRGVNNIICGTIQDIELTEEKIGAVGIFDVLEHIENDERFLKDINDILKTNGKLYITVPSFSFLWSNEDKEAGHYRRYTKKDIINKLNKTGYKINYISYFFSYLVLPIFLFRTIPSFIWKNKKNNASKEHNKKSKIIDYFSRQELKKITKGKNILFGSSILIEAEKIKI